jgi:hypothetical protein
MAVKRTKKTVETAKAVLEAVKPAKAKRAVKPKAEENANTYIVIDHPTEGEVISGIHYAIRIGASNEGSVEIAFNDGEWQPCRPAAGYWWYDWVYFQPGKQKLVARIIDTQGNVVKKSAVRKVEVI